LRREARSVRIDGRSIDELASMAIDDLKRLFHGLSFGPAYEQIARTPVREITSRLGFLEEVGLGYLTLGRGSDTLSGGELQRARLATQLGAGLVGVCYVLDEPTAGLHSRDTDRLIASLRGLLAQGNSVLVVEHDESVIRAADWVVDLGPGAGPDGGRIIVTGTPEKIAACTESITGSYLRAHQRTPIRSGTRAQRTPGWLVIQNATEHNLKGIDARIPLGTLTCITGVSGSGKSTLIHDVLAREYRRHEQATCGQSASSTIILGLEAIESLVEVDQTPIGRSPRSTPATFTGVFDEIRRVFAATRQAKMRGYKASRFSFNAKGGRCETCTGLGRRRVPMQFLPDLYVICKECQGQRFNRATLEVHFKGKSIGEVLDLRVDEARSMFNAHPRVFLGLDALHEVGVGYLTLGQSSTTLSGGEAQRIKLAAQLGGVSTGRTLYILDEPTTGLHFADVDRMLKILHRLADLGNTVVVIEHNLDVIGTADWVIDLGPDGGDAGGRIVAMGPPETIVRTAESQTGYYLKERTEGAGQPGLDAS
jgi:excinuclease ABC subunit A